MGLAEQKGIRVTLSEAGKDSEILRKFLFSIQASHRVPLKGPQ